MEPAYIYRVLQGSTGFDTFRDGVGWADRQRTESGQRADSGAARRQPGNGHEAARERTERRYRKGIFLLRPHTIAPTAPAIPFRAREIEAMTKEML